MIPRRVAQPGLVASLREEVELWKTNFQQQIEASATASGATESPNGEKAHNGDSESPRLGRALQEAEEAREEAERWKEKALAAQEFQGGCTGVVRVRPCPGRAHADALLTQLFSAY